VNRHRAAFVHLRSAGLLGVEMILAGFPRGNFAVLAHFEPFGK